MDMFGTAPICEKIGEINPSSKSRAELFAWIEKELNESIPSLSESKTETYGRVSKWGAYALLARLYLKFILDKHAGMIVSLLAMN